MKLRLKLAFAILAFFALNVPAVTRYVDLNSPSPTPPFTSWPTAATNIQQALDTCTSGDLVLVTNGLYQVGSRLTGDGNQNRVVVTNAVILQSVNGPTQTAIDGGNAVRCVFMTNGAVLLGFALTNGLGGNGGAIFCASTNEQVRDSRILFNTGSAGGGVYGGFISNCTILANVAGSGGGACGATLTACTLLFNRTGKGTTGIGGGALFSTLDNCLVISNKVEGSTYANGGGVANCVLETCTLSGNTVPYGDGAGASYSTLFNCIITNNNAGIEGGGTYSCSVTNCLMIGNWGTFGGGAYRGKAYNSVLTQNRAQSGGGAYEASLYNCTAVGNSATYQGGVHSCVLFNSIVINNTVGLDNPNYGGPGMQVNYSLTAPLPSSGTGNFSSDPIFVDWGAGDFHLATNSPCIEAGSSAYVATSFDYDSHPRIVGNQVDVGAYEFQNPTYIQIQPQSQAAYGNLSATFNVIAASPLPLKYQWLFNGVPLSGATNAMLTLTNLQATNVGNYSVVLSNAFVSLLSSNATLSVSFPAPVIISPPVDQAAVLGSNTQFSVTAFSPYPVSYQWLRNGSNVANGVRVAGATNAVLSISSVQKPDGGSYQVAVGNAYGAVTSSIALLTVLAEPVVLIPPSNLVTMAFCSTNLSVVVTGAPPLLYRWQKSGTNLSDGGTFSGTSTPQLQFLNPQPTDSGLYGVLVSNSFGSSTSLSARVTVVPVRLWGNTHVPVPEAATNLVGISAGGDYGWGEFNVALRGDGNVVAWGDGYSGSTNVPASATNVVAIAAGQYHGLALRQDGTVVGWGENYLGEAAPLEGATNVVAITGGSYSTTALKDDGTVVGWGENPPPSGLSNIVAIAGGYEFTIALRQDGTVFGWGANYYGATTPYPAATNIVAIAAGTFHILMLRSDGTLFQPGTVLGYSNVTAISSGDGHNLILGADDTVTAWGYNYFGEVSVPTNLAKVEAVAAREYHSMVLVHDDRTRWRPRFFQQPFNCAATVGQAAILMSQANGSRPMQFQWYRGATPLLGQTNQWLALTAIQTGQAGDYRVVVTNSSGAVTSRVATVSVSPLATIAAQPTNISAVVGSNAVFSVAMFGLPPFGYQWYFNGSPLADGSHYSGSGSATLTVANVQIADGGSYSVVITNASNATTSTFASLTVLVPPGITSQPVDRSILLNSNTLFSASATGTGYLAYRWMRNGVNVSDGGRISGGATASMSVTGAQTNDTGDYQVVVVNSYGSATSAVARLTVYVPANVVQQPNSQAVLTGGAASFSATGTGTLLGYQWYFNNAALTDDGRISGSASPTVIISNVQSADVGGYWVMVTNLLSSKKSMTASLTPLTVATSSVRYVNMSCATPQPPYLSWSSAATNIHDAIDAAVGGDLILVTNGVYQDGGRVISGSMTNRVAVNKAVTVQSVNGAASTWIVGARSVASNNSVRCVYLTNNASLRGFTLTNGAANTMGDILREQSGGGIWCESTNCFVGDCIIVSNTAAQFGGGLFSGACSNSVLTLNTATNGGGAFGGVLIACALGTNSAVTGAGAYSNLLVNCALIGNKATGQGGGAYGCQLISCTVSWNTNANFGAGLNGGSASNTVISNNVSVGSFGGGAYNSVLNDCWIINNSANRGGGTASSTLTNCTVTGNLATDGTGGGGVLQSKLSRCRVIGNRAPSAQGGGGNGGTFNNCLIASNYAAFASGVSGSVLTNCTIVGHTNSMAAYSSTLRNCIVFGNSANYSSGTFVSSCTVPLPSGADNFTNDPVFVNVAGGDFRLASNSPCINAGNNALVSGTNDCDGNPRIAGGSVDIGAFELQSPVSALSYIWAQQYGLATDGLSDLTDADGDGLNNWQEWRAGTVPTNAASALRMVSATNGVAGLTVSWEAVSSRRYWLERATNLGVVPSFKIIATNILGAAGTKTFNDTSATNGGPYFYRVGVQ